LDPRRATHQDNLLMLLKSTLAALALIAAAPAASLAQPDDQGWNGPGWYISGGGSSDAAVLPSYILFDGPHGEQQDCLTLHDRLYAPIGACRYLNVKPAKTW